MRIATWNVNSLNVRMPRVEEWLAIAEPDVVCLQETKLDLDAFPSMAFKALGYDSVHHGTGRWNGVAILSRVGLTDVVEGFADGDEPDPEPRLITATCGGVRVMSVYVPNGRAVGHDHYHYKLAWLGRLRRHLDAVTAPDADAVVAGDFNICPDDRDVWSTKAFEGETHVTPPEREALADVCSFGLTDTFRQHHESDGLFSWWDYRAGNFHKKQGLRIDLVLATAPLAARSTFALIDRNARKGTQPSDHAPVFTDFAAA